MLDKIIPHLETIYSLIEEIAKIDESEPNMQKLILGLIGDLATIFPQNPGVKQKSTMPYVEQTILSLKESKSNDFKVQADYTLKAI